MKNVLNIFAVIFSAFLLFSCEPSRDLNGDFLIGVNPNTGGGGNGGGTTGIVKNLKSVTSIDGSGETLIYNYTYASGKLIGVKASDNSVSYDLFYDNDILNKINVIQDDGIITKTNFTITYNNGKFLKAVGLGSEDSGTTFTNTLDATYTNNKITKILSKLVGNDISDPNTTYDLFTFQSDITYTGNNINTWKFSTTFPATPPISIPPLVINATFSDYDSYRNPFNNLPEAFNIISSLYGSDSTAVIGFSTNNYKKITVSTDADTQSAVYTYTYDKDGYPTVGVASNNLGTLTFVYQ